MASLSKEKFALRGSIVILCAWVLSFFAGPFPEAMGEEAEFMLGMFWIFIFFGLALATFIFFPILPFKPSSRSGPPTPDARELAPSHCVCQCCP